MHRIQTNAFFQRSPVNKLLIILANLKDLKENNSHLVNYSFQPHFQPWYQFLGEGQISITVEIVLLDPKVAS